jgi:hypothetical protein
VDEPEPAVCRYDDHYEDASFFVSFEAVPALSDSRFFGREVGTCGDATLALTSDAKGTTLTLDRDGRSAVVFRDASEFVMLEGCVDLTGDGAVELVLRRPDGTRAGSTEVVALEATPRTLFKVPFDLELRKTRSGPFPYELVNDDGFVFTEPQLPLVFAYRSGRFERIGSKDRDYWNGRRELVKKVLECNAKMPDPMPRAFVNLWFSASLYLGDWDDEQKSFPIDPTQLLELELARPLLTRALDGDASLPPVPPNVWLASKGAPAEITKALARLATLPAPAETTDVENIAANDDAGTPLPPGFRFLNVPKGEGTVLERCGTTVVEQVSDDELSHYVRLRAADGRYIGRIVPAERIGHAAAEWCFDLTGDGVPELLVTESSGGAHCCHTFRVLSLGTTPQILLEFAAGNAWLEGPENLDGKGPYELVGRDDFLTRDASASSYAGTYFVPIVFVLENGKYVRRTRRFKKFLEREREELAADYRAEDPSGMTDDPSGWMALSLLVGDWEKAKAQLPIQPSSRAWFDPEGTLARIRRDIER